MGLPCPLHLVGRFVPIEENQLLIVFLAQPPPYVWVECIRKERPKDLSPLKALNTINNDAVATKTTPTGMRLIRLMMVCLLLEKNTLKRQKGQMHSLFLLAFAEFLRSHNRIFRCFQGLSIFFNIIQ